jgi:serine phosphatase RsbU (regulator of sigma subunit)/Flp pilus assembly protein TadD
MEGDLTEALQNQLKALEAQEEIADKAGIIKTYNGIADIYGNLRNYDRAIEYGLKALQKAEEYKLTEDLRSIYLYLGMNYSRDTKYEKATHYFRRAILASTEAGDANSIIYSYNNLGAIFLQTYQRDSAELYYSRANDLLQYSNDKEAIATTCVNYGSLLFLKGNYTEAEKHLTKALTLLHQMGQLRGLPETYGALAEIAAAKKDYKKAYELFRLSAAYNDSTLNKDVQKKIADLQVLFEKEKSDKKIQLIKKDKDIQTKISASQRRQKNIILISGIIIVFLLCTFITIVINRFKLTRRQKNLIELKEKETARQKELIEEKQKEIIDSINYARRIQHSLLASDNLLNSNLPDYFILFNPKDIVSGDFYWAAKLDNGQFALITADSTGHGVPGAIMCMLNIACLNEAIGKHITGPHHILYETRKSVIEHLSNDGSAEGGKDGMDCSLLCFDFDNKKLYFSGANNPAWIVRSKSNTPLELIELNPDKMPVGKHVRDAEPFTLQIIDLQENDLIYTFTDGFADQFGGPKGKKFKYKQLQDILVNNAHHPLTTQKEILANRFKEWKGDLEQIDDVLLIGIKI